MLLGIIVNITRTLLNARYKWIGFGSHSFSSLNSSFFSFFLSSPFQALCGDNKKRVQNCHVIIYCVERIEVDARWVELAHSVQLRSTIHIINKIYKKKTTFKYIKRTVCNCVVSGWRAAVYAYMQHYKRR